MSIFDDALGEAYDKEGGHRLTRGVFPVAPSGISRNLRSRERMPRWPIHDIVLFLGLCARINTILCASTLYLGTQPLCHRHHCAI